MSSISGIFDPLDFTGTQSKAAAKKVAKSNEKAQEIQRESVALAREDLFKLFPASQQNVLTGTQAALDIFGQSLPAQAQALQQGNVAAQQQLLAGLPQFQNAILGGNVDFSQLQAPQFQQPDLSFFQQQLPEFVDPFAPSPVSDIPVPQRQFRPLSGTTLGGGGRSLGGEFKSQRR